MKFSICIPNFNYEKYIGATINSALNQLGADLEILVSDNASTDGSVAVVRAFQDPRVKLHVNACNVGFAGNLDRTALRATGDVLILLSSDDLLRPDSLDIYRRFFVGLGKNADHAVITSPVEVVGSQDELLGKLDVPDVWSGATTEPALSSACGAPVFSLPARELLKRSVLRMQNPFHFAATAYPRKLYNAVEGYGGSRLINPDKWFHWKLLSVAETAYYIARPISAYRWHNSNQTAKQTASGALKYLVDEYISTFELPVELLEELSLTRNDIEKAFMEHDVLRGGMVALARGNRAQAKRLYRFGQATYPSQAIRNWKMWLFRSLICLGPIGSLIARSVYHYHRRDVTDPTAQ